jgi:heme-degrading monooxygenase HmoA
VSLAVNVTRVSCPTDNLERYLALRRDTVNPAMAAQPGFVRSVLLRPHGAPEGEFLLLNFWQSVEDRERWKTVPVHQELRGQVLPLVQHSGIRTFSMVPIPQPETSPELVPGYATTSIHRVKPGQEQEYYRLREEAVHPDMGSFPGFISTQLLQDEAARQDHLVFNQWVAQADSERYASSPIHDRLRERVRALLIERVDAAEYDVVGV